MAGISHDAPDCDDVSDNEGREVIVDERLCFMQNKIDVLPPQTIADLCVTTFDDTAIEKSKKRLFDLCADETTSRFRRRQGPKKSAVNIDDMIRLLQEKGTDVPVFVARDLSRLPPITFDSVDVSSLLHSIRRAQLEIDQLKACVGGQRDATVDLTDVVKAVDRRLSAVETDRGVVSPVSVVRTEPPVTVAVTGKQDDVNGHAISRAPDSTPGPLDGSQWPVLAAVSTCRNGRQSSVAHRSRSRVFSLLPCRRLHVTAVQRASLEADKEVDFGRLNASDLQVSLRLGLSRKSPVTTFSCI